ncbi:FAD-binding protein [Sphaerisporangium sp. NBC_01403]|uniref:FAD-binding oxidoreductase n=1 Tax=Sphaerisporangium sp. NBC_01403 TaxID=2903599 RepID=UPI00324B0CA6
MSNTFTSGSVGHADGTGTRGRAVDWDSLRRHLRGDLILPSDPRYAHARELAIGQFDAINPRAVAYCTTEQDVQAVIAFAQDKSLHTVPRSGGHSFGGYSTTEGVVLDVSRLNHVRIKGPNVVVGAGAQQVDVLNTLTPHGLVLAGGTCPTVCVGGFVQGGGVGWQTRKFGLASDRMVGATVVLANGHVVRASAEEHPDLFWALRGNGGGNYGVVTSYELKPVHVSTMVNYMVAWPWEAAKQLIEQWQPWAIGSPDDLAAYLIAMNPDAGTGPPQLFIYGAWYRGVEELDRHLDTLVGMVGVSPVHRMVAEKPVYDAIMEFYGCGELSTDQCHRVGYSPEAQMPRDNFYRTRNRMFGGPVPTPNVDRLLETFTESGRTGQFRMLYFETLGGAANGPARTDTAYVHRTTEMLTGYTVSLTNPDYTAEDAAACEEWLADGFRVLDRDSLRESYQNYMDPALPDWRQAYYAENYPRLVQIKRKYDPHRFFHFAQSIG